MYHFPLPACTALTPLCTFTIMKHFFFIMFISSLFCLSCVFAALGTPIFTKVTDIKAPFIEQFSDSNWKANWVASEAMKKMNQEGDKEVEEFKFDGEWAVEEPNVLPGLLGDKGLVMKSKAKHHAISSLFPSTIDPKDKPLVIQYEVKFQDGLECGGAYLKLLSKQSKSFDAKEFDDKSPYTIMFGPDRCGMTNKIHFIFRHKNPKTGEYEEKHLTDAPPATVSKTSTLYTLVVYPDNEFTIYVNQEKVASGNLLKDFTPSVNPPKEIDDKADKKPSDWIDEEKIPDPDAKKPSDWDENAPLDIEDLDAVKPSDWLENESQYINDPDAKKPSSWNDEDDGEWIAPKILNPKCQTVSGCGPWKRPMKKNPNYKGKWNLPMIDNPKYKGPWIRKKIPNPNYFEDLHPHNFEPMSAIGFELWTMQANILFDNIFIGHSEQDAAEFAKRTWAVKYSLEQTAQEKEEEQNEEREQTANEDSLFHALFTQLNALLKQFKEDPVFAVQNNLPIVLAITIGFIFFVFAFSLLFKRKSIKMVKTPADIKKKKNVKDSDESDNEDK